MEQRISKSLTMLLRIGLFSIFTTFLSGCTTTHQAMTFQRSNAQPMWLTIGVITEVESIEIPKATWKDGAYNGSTYGQGAGQAISGFAGSGVAGVAIILVSESVGAILGKISDSVERTTSGQRLVFVPDSGGEAKTLIQPDRNSKLRVGDRVRIVEGSFVTQLRSCSRSSVIHGAGLRL